MTATDDVDRFLQEREALPKRCPAWCIGQHVEGLEEGNDLADASRHISGDFAVTARRRYRPGEIAKNEWLGSIRTEIFADHTPAHWETPTIHVEASLWNDDYSERQRATVPLTSGEARVLARQLLHLADLVDLG